MKLVYVCAPFAGNVELNIAKATEAAAAIVREGDCPVVPHLLFPPLLDEATERHVALDLCLRLAEVCDEMRVYGEPTPGMEREIARFEAVTGRAAVRGWAA